MANRGPLLRWSNDTWERWGAMQRLALCPVPRTKFLLLKAPVSTAYEEKYGDRNVFTVSMYVQRLIAKNIAVGLVIDCTALDLVLFDCSTDTSGANGSMYYFHNSAEWDDFGIDYHRLTQEVNASRGANSMGCVAPSTIQEFINTCIEHWKNNPTLHIAMFDSRGGHGVASFLVAYYLCQKLKAPVHTALSILEKASPTTKCEQKGLYGVDLIEHLQKQFFGKKEIVVNKRHFPSWWFPSGVSPDETVVIPPIEGKRPIEGQNRSTVQRHSKKLRLEDKKSDYSLPLQTLNSESQRYKRAKTVIKQLIGNLTVSSDIIPSHTESTLTDENLHVLKEKKYLLTWGSAGRSGLLLVLSDGIFFLENEESCVKISIVTCPLFIPNPENTSICQHRTVMVVTLVMDREGGKTVPRFLVSDILVMSSGELTHKPFSHRLKYIADGIILARKKSAKNWNYSKERIRIRAKEFFGVTKADFVWKQVIQAQCHDTIGLRFVPEEVQYMQPNDFKIGNHILVSNDERIIHKIIEHIKVP